MEIKETEKLKKNLTRFYCEKCDFKCYMKCDWDRHLMRAKHQNNSKQPSLETVKLKKTYYCVCGKNFLSNSGLWKHTNKCNIYKEENEIEHDVDHKENILADKDLILMLIKQNAELLEIVKNGTNNNSHNHSHNKTFNLQFFLNETCKDAMNIMDFVDSIKYKITDLEKMGEIGYVEGISNIITSNLNALDVTQRPIHCADKKREVLYIKDDDKWEKENEDKNKLRKVIKRVAHNNSRLIKKYKETHPDCDGKNSDQYNKMIIEAMGGLGNDDKEKEDKIIRNISKNVVIDKDMNKCI
jgi:hypothetical protein